MAGEPEQTGPKPPVHGQFDRPDLADVGSRFPNRQKYAPGEGKPYGNTTTLERFAGAVKNILGLGNPGARHTQEPKTLAKGIEANPAPTAPATETSKE